MKKRVCTLRAGYAESFMLKDWISNSDKILANKWNVFIYFSELFAEFFRIIFIILEF